MKKNSQYLMPYVTKLLFSQDYQVRFLSVETIGNQNYTNAIKDLLLLANTESDVFLQIEIAKTLCILKESKGIYLLAKIIKNSSEKIAQEDALNVLKNIVSEHFFKEHGFIDKILNNKINFIFNEKLNKFN
jgi:HEAT repeat protein